MGKIDDLIARKNDISSNNNTIEQKISRYYEIKRELDMLEKDLDKIYDEIDYFINTEDYQFEKAGKIKDNIEKLKKELEELCNSYKKQVTELDEFDSEKDKYLKNLVSTEHISTIGEEPDSFFEKLIELYGEEGLAHFYYTDNRDEENDDNTNYYYTYQISNFVSGYEDKIIGLVSDTTLKEKLLASKLEFMSWNSSADIFQYIQEYADAASEHGHKNIVYFNEYGEVDLEPTLADFSILRISEDKNFYLYLAKHLDEMQLPVETLLDYIDPDMIDEEFGTVLADVNNTKKYEYQDKFFYSSKTQKNRALIEGLERKEEELSSLEDENRTISEALKDQQETGKDIGEE